MTTPKKEMRVAFIIAVLLLTSLQIPRVNAAPDPADDQEPSVGPEVKPLPPLVEQDLENLTADGRTREWRRTPLKIFGISSAIHAGGSFIFLLAWGVKALSQVTIDWGGHGDDDDYYYDSPPDKSPPVKDSMPGDVFLFGIIGLPATSGILIFVGAAVANHMGSRTLWTRSRYLPIFLGGLIGWGVNTGLMFALAQTTNEAAFVVVPILGAALLPPVGEMVGYMVAREPVETGPMRIKEAGVPRHQSRLETQWIPPMLTLLPVPGQSYPVPGLLLGGARF